MIDDKAQFLKFLMIQSADKIIWQVANNTRLFMLTFWNAKTD